MSLKEGTRVLVTAGASGIGLATAKLFKDNGARVQICDVSESHLEKALREIPSLYGSQVDVADLAQVDKLFDDVRKNLGGLDVLVNNAGVAGPTLAVEEIAPEDWNRTMAVNITGQFLCARRAVPLLKESGGGSIINLSSVAGRFGYPLRTPYAASKWAVVGFTKSLAIELGPHKIRVNAIQPGLVSNQRAKDVIRDKAQACDLSTEEMEQIYLNQISLREFVTEADIAQMMFFLASDAGRNISGQAISVCGNTEYLA